MDGVISGLTSIVPILPEQSTITDRNGVKGPPVEIMPLPTNSFLSENATAELLNNPFTLSLDIKGYNHGEGGKAVGRNAAQPGRTAVADDEATDALLNHAYTLTLGNEENIPVAAEVAREMSRMKNYEMLGKSVSRQLYRMNPDTGAAENITAPEENSASMELIGEKVNSLLSQSFLPQLEEAVTPMTAQNADMKTILQQLQGMALTSPELLPEGAVNTPLAAQPGEAAVPAGIRQDMSLLSGLAAVRLSASDIETILTLEPDLQEALLNMLSSVNKSVAGKMTLDAPNELLNLQAEVLAGSSEAQNIPVALTENNAVFIDKNLQIHMQPGVIRQRQSDMTQPLNADTSRAALLTDDALAQLTAETVTGGKVLSAFSQSTLRGNMGNLQKVNELPYSLYLFGNVNPSGKEYAEAEDDIAISEESGAMKMRPDEFLRLSEAIKMAAVLHNIYYGGSGRFPQEMPWFAPYVRYAVRNGIIKDDDFGDVNELATRAETAYIFSGCVPRAEFPVINQVPGIPDVSETDDYAESIYRLYRAGILTKSDKSGSFYPERLLTRSEAATIIGRIATPGDRKIFEYK